MEYNLAGIRQRVLIDKLDDDEFDPDIVDRFINDTQRSIFNQYELPFMEKIFQGTIPAGSTMFKMPADISQIQAQTIAGIPGFKDRYIPFREFFSRYGDIDNNPPSQIATWTLYGGNMVVNAPTDREYVMNMFYIKKPGTLALPGDVPEIPEEFGELLVLGAFRRIHERNEDYDLAREVDNQYYTLLNSMVERYANRQSGTPMVMGQLNRR